MSDRVIQLLRSLHVDHIWEFMSFSSYGSGTTSSGAVQLVLDLKMDIKGRDVLVIEDILDTGNTLRYMLKQLNAREPRSIKTCVLLHKVTCYIPLSLSEPEADLFLIIPCSLR